MNSFRMNYGLRWERERISLADMREQAIDAAITAALVVMILLAFGIVGAMDYADEQRAEAERTSALLAACMNGDARFLTPGTHGSGYNQVAVACRKAEEFRL